MQRFLALIGYLKVRHFLQVLMPQRCSPSPSRFLQYFRAHGYLGEQSRSVVMTVKMTKKLVRTYCEL